MPRATPYRYVRELSPVYRAVREMLSRRWYAGDAVECPVCEGRFRRWLGDRDHGTCPGCRSEARHRIAWIFLLSKGLTRQRIEVLHFAPESCFSRRFAELSQATYTTADLASPEAEVHTDITDLVFDDEAFDLVICSHVLEHVPDDAAAMAELHRVVAPGGHALIQVPASGRPTTDEDPTVVDPAEREARFGQFDHVRLYGLDIQGRLERAGFEVEVVYVARRFTPEESRRHGLWDDVLYWCRRPQSFGLAQPHADPDGEEAGDGHSRRRGSTLAAGGRMDGSVEGT